MSMKLGSITEVVPMDSTELKKKVIRNKRASLYQTIVTLYVLTAINALAVIVLWLRVFFYHCNGGAE